VFVSPSVLSSIVAENRDANLIHFADVTAERASMRIRFHKILNDGRSVRYEKGPEERDIIDLNIIVMKDGRVRGRE